MMCCKTFHILTFGCQMNVRDSSWIAASLEARGFVETAIEEARVIIINTCSVREKPEKKVASLIGRIQSRTGGSQDVMIAVAGCVAQQLGAELFALGPQVRLVAGADGVASIPAAVDEIWNEPGQKKALLDFSPVYAERELLPEKWPASSAFVNIMQGCDNFCAYCIVPFTRGRQHSRFASDIIRECGEHLRHGASEITLLGQNVNAWGKDNNAGSFPDLLRCVAELPGLRRLRFVTPHPKDMDDGTVAAFAELPNLCPRLHLPLQSGSDAILSRMRRRYTRKDFLNLVHKLRRERADLALSTDLIVGFPGETEADFQDTLSLMEECGFMSSFSFCYSDRPGTRASLMPDKVSREIMNERLIRLQSLQEELSQKWLLGRVGEEEEILLERPSVKKPASSWQGRDPWGMIVNVETANALPGQYANVRITAAKKHSLYGRIISV